MALYHTYLGERYRVHDEVWLPLAQPPVRVVTPGTEPVAHRLFVTEQRDVYSVQLVRDEWRHTDTASLDRLLAIALSHGRRMRRGEAVDVYLAALRHARVTHRT